MTIKEIDASLEEGQSLKQIAQAYSEIANLKIKRIRTETERNRVFFQEISRVYALIKKIAVKKKVNVEKPKKTTSLVITSNYHFYGNINSDLLEYFVDFTRKLKTDYIILGKAAIDYFKASKRLSNYQEFLLKDDQPDSSELISLTSLLKGYNQALVFYSTMKSLLVQQPTVIDLTALYEASQPPKDQKSNMDFNFIFEPHLPKILEFFDSQITLLLLENTFLESELSRTASRFISMDKAETEANKFIKDYQRLKAYTKRGVTNNTILENFASMMAVRKEGYGSSDSTS